MLLEWLSPEAISPETDHANHCSVRTEGTAQWIFSYAEYDEKWVNGLNDRVLWLSGERTSMVVAIANMQWEWEKQYYRIIHHKVRTEQTGHQ